jgi:hypothetical protein
MGIFGLNRLLFLNIEGEKGFFGIRDQFSLQK